jgi:hypothetical protein
MNASSRRSPLFLTLTLALALPFAALPAGAQTQTQKPPAAPRPSTAKPSTAKPSTAKPAQPTAKPAAPEPAKPPAPPPPQDVRFKSTYTNGDMKTESVTFIKGARERYEFQDMVLLKQPDQKRTIQISKSANTYLVAPDGMPTPGIPGAAPAGPPKPPGVIMVATTIVDTGERKAMFGQQARHVKLMIDKQPMAGACDTSKQRIETDGWYVDNPPSIANRPAQAEPPQPSPDGCTDQVQATSNGDPKVLGFPIAYTTTLIGDDGKPLISSMEVTEYEATNLDAALFEIPPGLNAAMNIRELSKALSNANEAKLVAASAEPVTVPAPKTPGVVRIAVPEFTNKTQQTVDTRALRQRLISDLAEAKFEAVPMPATTPAEAQKRAGEMGADYVLLAEVSELKVNKPGAFGGLMKAAGGVAGGRGGVTGMAAGAAAGAAGGPPKENTESSIQVKLVQPDGKQRLSTTTKGKDGSGFTLKSGLGIAKYAGGMYLGMMAGPMMFSKLAGAGAFNTMGGMGMLGNPYLYQMQGAGLSGLGKNIGMDATAGAAAHLMQSGMAMDSLGGFVGVPGQGPSYDESLGEAVQNAAKAVQKALEKK